MVFYEIFGIVLGCVVFTIAAIFALSIFYSPDTQQEIKHQQLLYNQTKAIIEDPNVSCDQLIKLRIANAQGKYSLEGQGYLNQIRDLYNAKNCGQHWGYWEN